MPPRPSKQPQQGDNTAENQNPREQSSQAGSSGQATNDQTTAAPKKKKHRAGRKRRNRRPSFATQSTSERGDSPPPLTERTSLPEVPEHTEPHPSFYRLHNRAASTESLESEALLDHRSVLCIRTERRLITVEIKKKSLVSEDRALFKASNDEAYLPLGWQCHDHHILAPDMQDPLDEVWRKRKKKIHLQRPQIERLCFPTLSEH